MPNPLNLSPRELKPFQFLGVNIDYSPGAIDVLGDCPLCLREGKFSVKADTGEWRCFGCNAGAQKGGTPGSFKGGNLFTFLRLLWEEAGRRPQHGLEDLARDRRVSVDTLSSWGVVKSPLNAEEWLVPGYNLKGQLCQLYRYVRDDRTGKRTLLATPTLHHQIHGTPLMDPKGKTLYVCEGPWDAMALWETLRSLKPGPGGSDLPTGDPAASRLAGCSVIGVPGAGVLPEAWLPLFKDKDVVFLYDNDHPKTLNGVVHPPYSLMAMRRASSLLAGTAEFKPSSVKYLHWGDQGYDPELPDGTDVRDWLTVSSVGNAVVGWKERSEYLHALLNLVRPVPDDWVPGRDPKTVSKGGVELEPLPCQEWRAVVSQWKRATRWYEGMETAFAVMLASIISTKTPGDQLWIKVIGPASCGKSTLCEALAVSTKYVKSVSTMRGFHSGYLTDKEGTEDPSLLNLCRDKTLITKDGDTLMTSPNVGQILGEARDIYDRVSRTHFRHGKGRDYLDLNMTWILCGTSALRALDSSELGERFLDVVMMTEIDEQLEQEIATKAAFKAARNLGAAVGADGLPNPTEDPEYLLAKRLTGGYVNHLRENAEALLSRVVMDAESLRYCVRLGTFTAYMRARPSGRQKETAEREVSTRLTGQLVRLMGCLAAVTGKASIDEEVRARIRKVALDTSRGRALALMTLLAREGDEGLTTKSLATYTGETENECRELLKFLRRIKAVDLFQPKTPSAGKSRWRLAPGLIPLYTEVTGLAYGPDEDAEEDDQ